MDRKLLAAWAALFAVVSIIAFATRGALFRSPLALAAVALSVAAVTLSAKRKPAKVLPAASNDLPTINLILRVAKAHKGRITAAEVLAETTLPLEEVTTTLDELTLAGTCQLVVGQKGTQVYYFPEFESDAEKDKLVT